MLAALAAAMRAVVGAEDHMPVESSAQLLHGFVQLPKLVRKQPGLVAHIVLPVVQPVEVHNEQRRPRSPLGQAR